MTFRELTSDLFCDSVKIDAEVLFLSSYNPVLRRSVCDPPDPGLTMFDAFSVWDSTVYTLFFTTTRSLVN